MDTGEDCACKFELGDLYGDPVDPVALSDALAEGRASIVFCAEHAPKTQGVTGIRVSRPAPAQ